MSDIGTPDTSTITCAECGAQNSSETWRCAACGALLPGPDGDRQREVIETEEAWRGAAASGYDTDAEVEDGRVVCPRCRTEVRTEDLPLDRAWRARDTDTPDELMVVAYDCPGCDTALRTIVAASETSEGLARPDGGSAGSDGRMSPDGDDELRSLADAKLDEWHDTHRSGAAPQDPVTAHPDRFEPGAPGTLADLGPLEDAEGEDIRQYTGEPVETEQGWVIPQQQNFAGKDNIAGGGEYPDPNTPSAQPGTGERPEDPEQDDADGGGAAEQD